MKLWPQKDQLEVKATFTQMPTTAAAEHFSATPEGETLEKRESTRNMQLLAQRSLSH